MARRRVRLIGLAGGVVAGFLLAGCNLVGYQNELGRSLETWQQLKTKNGDHYRYEVSSSSALTPPTITTLTVKNGSVVERSYVSTDYDEDGNDISETWTEVGHDVGSHEYGSEPLTLGARYSRCQDDVLSQNPIANDINLDFLPNGILSVCYSIPKNVVYDGGAKVLTKLKFLPLTE